MTTSRSTEATRDNKAGTFLLLGAKITGAALVGLWLAKKYWFSTNSKTTPNQKSVYRIKLQGYVSSEDAISFDKLAPTLQTIFSDKNSQGVVFEINSPGGSPVQASLIYNEIIRLKTKYNKKVVVVAQDTLASAAYCIACSADKIYINENTQVGSIGVISRTYGLDEFAENLGIKSRVYTLTPNKNRLDSLKPESKEDVEKTMQDLGVIYQNFVNTVKKSRGEKITDLDKVTSGDTWIGSCAIDLGLADGIGNIYDDAVTQEFEDAPYLTLEPESVFSFSSASIAKLVFKGLFSSQINTETLHSALPSAKRM